MSPRRMTALAAAWRELVRVEAAIASTVQIERGAMSWVDHDAMLALHEEADLLRALSPDEEWKRPFNEFRGVMLHQDLAGLRALAGRL